MLNTNIKSKPIPINLLGYKLIVYKDTLKPRINKDIYQLAQSRTTKTLLWQLSVTYPLGAQKVTYLIVHYIILFGNLVYIHKLLSIIYSDFFFITSILCLILSILTLLPYQALLASLLGVMDSINGCSIVLNLTKLFSISTGMRESLGDIVVKDIKGLSPLKPRLLKSLKACNRNYPKIGKLTLI